MFIGKPTRIITALVVCAQIFASLFLAIVVPAPQSQAREAPVLLEARDLPANPEPESEPELQTQPIEAEVEVGADWEPVEEYACEPMEPTDYYGADQLRTQGVICDDEYRYTWYSQRVLPGGGLTIDGRHVSSDGYVVDAAERIVVASSDLPYGTELDVPFGSGKAVVLDTGCASGTIDVYTDF